MDRWAVAPGQRVSRVLETLTYRDGVRVGIPVVVMRGAEDGPTLTVLAAQHGRELNGIEAIRRVMLEVDPRRLRGCAMFIPCANPLAVRIRQQDFPHERGRYLSSAQGFNLSFEWPGAADGTLYQQMADVLWREVVSRSSVCIDLHGWSGASASLVWGALRDADLVRAFGLDLHMIKRGSDQAGQPRCLETVCWEAGISKITAELTPQKTLCEASVAAGARGVLNVMKKMGMLDGEPELPPLQIELDDGESEPHKEYALKAEFTGLLVPRVRVPALVKAGETFAELVDLDDVFHTQAITAPIDGVVFNVGGPHWSEEMAETSVKDAGETVALVKSYRRCIRTRASS
jgi:predicted deacylase